VFPGAVNTPSVFFQIRELKEHFSLQHGRFDAGTARAYFGQLVTGVAYLHSHSILHRDLKLSNLLLGSDNILVSWTNYKAAFFKVEQILQNCSASCNRRCSFGICAKRMRAAGARLEDVT
jgi:serine/threonine protein kinase